MWLTLLAPEIPLFPTPPLTHWLTDPLLFPLPERSFLSASRHPHRHDIENEIAVDDLNSSASQIAAESL
jgi:hypothetical protein